MPLRFSRPVMALIASGTAAICLGLSAMPALADQVRTQEWWLSSLRVTTAWKASQGAGVTVAVLSDGVKPGAADLAGAVTTGAVPTGFPVAAGQYSGELGTSIASLIAGRGHGPSGAAGVIGVAPKARILSIPVTLPPDDPHLAQSSVAAAIPAAIAAGIRYAVNHGATVIDLPIDPGQAASGGTGGATAAARGSAAERNAVNFALAHNVVLVSPAGDNGSAGDAPNYPAAYPGVISVGAFNSAFTRAPWSSHQSYVTLTAPGAGVTAANNAGGYQSLNSTSAASAIVSGVTALIRSRYPSLTQAQVRQVLITTTTYRRAGRPANGSGYGAVNAGQAMTAAATLARPPGKRASAGALPREAPTALPTPTSSQGIGAQILRAAEIAGAVLLFLLLLIAAYEALGRRRGGSRPVVAAEWTQRHGQSRYPHPSASDADRMLELFGAPALPPAPPRAFAAPAARGERFGPPPAGGDGWSGGGDGMFGSAAGRELGGSSVRQLGGPVADEPSVASASDGGWPSHGPASRAVNRRPSVSGTPPWEPASAPDGELPWAAVPGRHAGGPAAIQPARPALAPDERAWDDADHVVAGHVLSSHVPPSHGVEPAEVVPPSYQADHGYDPFRHDGQGEPTARGFSSPAGASPSGPYPSPFASGVPAGPPPFSGYRSPTGSGAPSDLDSAGHGSYAGTQSGVGYESGADAGAGYFSYRDGSAGPVDQSGFDAAPAPKHASGLPVRQPRASRPPGGAASSPTGSLWEPASRDAGEASAPADYRDQGYDSAGRPIFVWDPARDPESR